MRRPALEPRARLESLSAVETVQDYLARAEAAEAEAERCVDGSAEQRQFRELAAQWRKLAERLQRPWRSEP